LLLLLKIAAASAPQEIRVIRVIRSKKILHRRQLRTPSRAGKENEDPNWVPQQKTLRYSSFPSVDCLLLLKIAAASAPREIRVIRTAIGQIRRVLRRFARESR
jgi:hypothetical protein